MMLDFTKSFLWQLFFSVAEASVLQDIPEKPMVVLIPSYNNKDWAYKNLISVFKQDYSNYRVIYIDDASTDGTADEVKHLAEKHAQGFRFTMIQNESRQGGLSNVYHAASQCADDEIIICLDGDDWLANSWVLKTVNQTYSTGDIWLTHGTMVEYPMYILGWSIPIPEGVIANNAFRTYRCPSHLKTFYAWLFKRIDVEDLKYKEEFFSMTWDQAIMFPMLEMAGRHQAFIPEVLYIYNMANPLNDNKVDKKLQNDLERLIRSKPVYTNLLGSH